MSTTSVRIDVYLVKKMRAISKKKGRTIRWEIEEAITHSVSPKYNIGENSDALHAYLNSMGIKFKPNGGFTTVEVQDPVSFGIEWGIYKAKNDPAYKK